MLIQITASTEVRKIPRMENYIANKIPIWVRVPMYGLDDFRGQFISGEQENRSSLQCYSVLPTIAQILRKMSLKILAS